MKDGGEVKHFCAVAVREEEGGGEEDTGGGSRVMGWPGGGGPREGRGWIHR